MTHLLSLVVVGLAMVYVGLVLMLWWYQERVVFQPPASTAPHDAPARRVAYRAADGVELFAYVVGECSSFHPVVLAFHGNADIARWFVPWAAHVARETNACVVLPEYRGYDGISTPSSYASSALDARAALAFVRDSLHVAPERLVYFGHSLGTAIAAELAAFAAPRSLVLQAPFSSARAMAARMFVPGLTLFWRLISRVHFDTIARVRDLNSPVWVAHGDRDVIIPVRMGREVFDAAAERGELLIVHGAGHNDVPEVGGAEYWTWLRRAIAVADSSAATVRAPAAGTRLAP